MAEDTSKYVVGGWYNSRQWNGSTLGAPGVINMPGQQGFGQSVNNAVVAQTDPNNVAYIEQQREIVPGGQPVNPNAQVVPGGVTSPAVNVQPTIDIQSVYDRAYKTPEIGATQSEIDTKTKAFNDAQAIINDNPFYSEATRVGKVKKLQDQFNNEMTRLQDKQNRLRADAEVQVNLQLKQYDINNQAYKDQLSLFNSILDGGGLANASGQDIANYAKATGLSTSVIQGMIDKQNKDNIKTQVITTTDGIAVINSQTGEVISKTKLNTKSGAGTVADQNQALNSAFVQALSSVANSYGHVDPNTWNQAMNSYISRSKSQTARDTFIKNFAQFTDPNRGDFETAYGFRRVDRGITPPSSADAMSEFLNAAAQ